MLHKTYGSKSITARTDPSRGTEIQMTCLTEAGGPDSRLRFNVSHLAQLGAWLFESRRFLNYSVSTLYLGLSLLDHLRQVRFAVDGEQMSLLGGVVLLLSSKFNEIQPVTVAEINSCLGRGRAFELQQYKVMEAEVLEAIGFIVTHQHSLFLRFCEMHERFKFSCPKKVEELCKVCLQAPDLQRFGRDYLMEAIGLLCQGSRNKQRQASKLVKELIKQFEELQKNNYF